MKAINLNEKLKQINKQWHPHVIDESEDMQVYLSKIEGEFVMHTHDDADELFYVLSGTMFMKLEDREIKVCPGELILVPKGVLHCPRTEGEVHVLVVEKNGTSHTGNVQHEKTVNKFARL